MPFYNKILRYEEKWCKLMNFFNPYIDPFQNHLSNQLPFFDMTAYKRYPSHRFVYDKLWIVQSQGLPAGRLEDLLKGGASGAAGDDLHFPIFIKPRWGHLSASSKNCFKVSSAAQLKKYQHYQHMMWSGFVNAKEGMTDFFLLNGAIVHQLTYVYSDKQNGFTDDWKYVSPQSTPPLRIQEWVEQHMHNFTGVVNVQYRSDKIIEVGLRLARGGAYIVSTDNKALIQNINNLYLQNTWDGSLTTDMQFTPFYVFKCFTTMPVVYLLPQKVLDWFLRRQHVLPFYEYYFEPAGDSGLVFYQFMDTNFERGMQTKQLMQHWFGLLQGIFIGLGVLIIAMFALGQRWRWVVFLLVLFWWLTRYLNPMMANLNLYKAQRQNLFGSGPVQGPTTEDDDEHDEHDSKSSSSSDSSSDEEDE